MKRLAILLALALLTGCDPQVPPPTPTRALSAPTLAPSAQPFLGPPSEIPPDVIEASGQSDPTAAALPAQAALPPLAIGTPGQDAQPVEITADDGVLLPAVLYQHTELRMPGILILGVDLGGWGEFPGQLKSAGFTVLVAALREGAGAADVRVMLEALTSGMADPGRIAVIGASEGADLALVGCAATPVCDAAVLLSPLRQQPLLDALSLFNPRPLLQVVTQEDAESFSTAQALDAAASGDRLLQAVGNAGRGTAILLNRPDAGALIIQWLQQHLTEQPA